MDLSPEVRDVIDRIRRLTYHTIVVPIPPSFKFYGEVPFHMHIYDGGDVDVAECRVLALTPAEAEQRVREFFAGPEEKA